MSKGWGQTAAWLVFLVAITLIVSIFLLDIPGRNLSAPMYPGTHDEVWQLVLTKVAIETGWVNTNPFLGAPGVANWHFNPAAQQSALHSVLLIALSFFSKDAVFIQQLYFLLNFPLIAISGFFAARMIGINRLVATAVGILIAFSSYRFNFALFSFLANYPAVPLVIALSVLILMGKFRSVEASGYRNSSGGFQKLLMVLKGRLFIFGVVASVFVATSDGYYAFFAALLLGFAIAIRLFVGDWREWQSLAAPFLLLGTILLTALALSVPLTIYKSSHQSEFAPNGIPDPSLARLPMEAEVYAGNLKLLLAPIASHRIAELGQVGTTVVDSLNSARAFPTSQTAPLGILGGVLFATSVLFLLIPGNRARVFEKFSVEHSLASLSLFSFLCLTAGGIGPIVALFYPTIRAYDRMGLFLLFIVYLLGGALLSRWLSSCNATHRSVIAGGLVVLVSLSILDQTGRYTANINHNADEIFFAERTVVETIEAALPQGSMVYQYPHSQYMEDSSYYGWGAQAQIRLYLHSRNLRWSNGASKNSPSENWHLRTRKLPPADLKTEIVAAGFKAIVVDRTVVGDEEFQAFAAATDLDFTDDPTSRLAYAFLPEPAVLMTFDSYMVPSTIVVKKPMVSAFENIPFELAPEALSALVAADLTGDRVLTFDVKAHPELLRSAADLAAEEGSLAINEDDMVGEMSCTIDRAGTVSISLKNTGRLAWSVGSGPLPIAVGRHMLSATGETVEFDSGWRLSFEDHFLKPGETTTAEVALRGFSDQQTSAARFELLQEGVRWHPKIGCTISLP